MTFEEALKKLMKGERVKHKDWEDYEYITTKGNEIVTQSGIPCKIIMDQPSKDCWEEYKGDILDKEENEYLSAVIKPFRDKVTHIAKVEEDIHLFYWIMIRVDIGFLDDYYEFCLPPFEETSSMYKNMEVGKEYTLKELGL